VLDSFARTGRIILWSSLSIQPVPVTLKPSRAGR
jgi:hypothetical protein